MNADDLRHYQELLTKRESLINFLNKAAVAGRLMVTIPTAFEVEMGQASEGSPMNGVYIADSPDIIRTIAAAAGLVVQRQIDEIEKELTSAGIVF